MSSPEEDAEDWISKLWREAERDLAKQFSKTHGPFDIVFRETPEPPKITHTIPKCLECGHEMIPPAMICNDCRKQ